MCPYVKEFLSKFQTKNLDGVSPHFDLYFSVLHYYTVIIYTISYQYNIFVVVLQIWQKKHRLKWLQVYSQIHVWKPVRRSVLFLE